ncbi:MAG TPA: DNA repair protein RecN [Oligoflexia bacterium]|nr:DNA repair protein RecN [Oligoflexia bacterium]
MLRLLRIRNFAIIDGLELEFHGGLNVITGETGAGKSIVLEALGLVLGNRAETELIRNGCNEAVVEALFDLAKHPSVTARLEKQGIDLQKNDFELLVKRTIQRNGKNRIYLNDDLITLGQLADLCENLVDLCSQHEHQSLAKPIFQLELLDRYGGLGELRNEVRESYSALRSLESELISLKSKINNNESQKDFIRYQINEIDAVAPVENEDMLLQDEHRRLRNIGTIHEGCRNILDLTRNNQESQNGMGAFDQVGRIRQRLLKLAEQDAGLLELLPLTEQIQEELAQLANAIEAYSERIDGDPERLHLLEDRLTKINQLKRKYGSTISDILETRNRLSEKLEETANIEVLIHEKQAKFDLIRADYIKTASILSKKRQNVARTLKASVTKELTELRMPDTSFEIDFSRVDPESIGSVDGVDRIQFLFSANAGVEPRPLAKVASGGELSRLMLALRRTLGDRGGIGVYVFDEIDAGIGGQTGTLVGRKLKDVASHNQVLCITHLPQVAAFANAHYVVEKTTISAVTMSIVRHLDDKNRVEELARMLGGAQVTAKSRAHAQELIRDSSV